MKTEKELNILKNELEVLTARLQELNEDELKLVIGGLEPSGCYSFGKTFYDVTFPNPVTVTWGKSGEITNYLPNENDGIDGKSDYSYKR